MLSYYIAIILYAYNIKLDEIRNLWAHLKTCSFLNN